MTTRIHTLLIVAIVVGLIISTVDHDVRSQTAAPSGTPLIRVFDKPETRLLASGQTGIAVEPEGPYQGNVTVTIEKNPQDISSTRWGGMCIESG